MQRGINDDRMTAGGGYTMESRGVCVHDKDGVCSIHGPGAVRKHKPGKKVTILGPDGRPTFKMTKKYFYTCDVGEGGRRLKQTRISFGIPDASRTGRRRDT